MVKKKDKGKKIGSDDNENDNENNENNDGEVVEKVKVKRIYKRNEQFRTYV